MAIDEPKALEKYPEFWQEALKKAEHSQVCLWQGASYKFAQIEARRFRAFRKTAKAKGLLKSALSYRTKVQEKNGFYYLILQAKLDASASGRETLRKALEGNQ